MSTPPARKQPSTTHLGVPTIVVTPPQPCTSSALPVSSNGSLVQSDSVTFPLGQRSLSGMSGDGSGSPAEQRTGGQNGRDERVLPLPLSPPIRPLTGQPQTGRGSAGHGYTIISDGEERPHAPIRDALSGFCERLRNTPPATLLYIAALVVALMAGNAMMVISLNFWLDHFPSTPGSYTVLMVSGFGFSIFFLVALGLYIAARRPDLSFMRHKTAWKMLFWIGVMDTWNSAMAVFAAPQTPEVLQALFISLIPVYAALLTKYVLKDPRTYCQPYVLTSFALIIAGVGSAAFFYLGVDHEQSGGAAPKESTAEKARAILSAVYSITGAPGSGADRIVGSGSDDGSSAASSFMSSSAAASSASSSAAASSASSSSASSSGKPSESDTILWSFIFFLSVIPIALMNAGQTLFMTRYTYDEDFEAKARALDGGDGEEEEEEERRAVAAPEEIHPYHADDSTVKLVMLAGGTTVQALLTFLIMPIDALPWFGSSDSVLATWDNFMSGLDCVVNCPHNFTFGCLYCLGFVLIYVSSAYLNQYSVTLCSMVSQLSAPVTALVIVAFPTLNPSTDPTPWYISAISACILGLGTFIYVVWDEQTSDEKQEGEVRLKMQMLGWGDRAGTGVEGGHGRGEASSAVPVQYTLVETYEEGF